jgi:Zn-dependent protease
LHVTFLLLLAVIGYETFRQAGAQAAVWSLALICSIFACIALHELGHSVVAQQLGVQVRSITLLPIGGVAALRNMPENPWHEIAITLAGPMVNAGIAAALIPFVGLPHRLFLISMPHDLTGLLQAVLTANVALFLFNFIPAFPMDGGRLLRAVLALFVSFRRATVIAATVGQALAIAFVLAGLNFGWLWFIIIGAFIFMGAEGEERMVRMRSVLRELEVEEVMNRDFATLAPYDTVGRGLAMVYQTGQDDFPVVDGDRLVGLASRQAMLEAVNTRGTDVPVIEVMDSHVPVVWPQAKVAQAYEAMVTDGHASFPVMEGDRLVGLLSPDNISRYMLVQSSLKSRRRRGIGQSFFGRRPAPPPVISTVRPVATPRPREESAPPTAPA